LGEGRAFERFPILAKIIDAEANLSVQVHPDHFTAEKLKGEPKSEMWVMLEPGAVFAGIQSGVDAKKFQKALEQKKPEKVLEKFDLILGETAHIPGGRVHAICAGALIYEVQQNSNTTFRLYDWERGRDLHLKEGMQAIQWDEKRPVVATPKKISSDLHHQLVILLETEFFIAERIDVFDMLHIGAIPKTFQIFYCLKGEGIIAVEGHQEPFKPGMTYLIPAVSKSIEITGKCEALRVRLP
jgi:mannose-6-phosphate isomerase